MANVTLLPFSPDDIGLDQKIRPRCDEKDEYHIQSPDTLERFSTSSEKGNGSITHSPVEVGRSRASTTATNASTHSNSTSATSTATSHSPTSTRAAANTISPSTPAHLPLTIKTESIVLSSGFTYHPTLFHLGIAPDLWEQLSSDVVKAAKLSFGQYLMAVGAGAAMPLTGAIGTSVIMGRHVARKQAIRNVRKSLNQDDGLSAVLERWNRDIFGPKSLGMRLDMPDDIREQDDEKDELKRGASGTLKKKRSIRERMPWQKSTRDRRRFAIVIFTIAEGTDFYKQTSLKDQEARLASSAVTVTELNTSVEQNLLPSVAELPAVEEPPVIVELPSTNNIVELDVKHAHLFTHPDTVAELDTPQSPRKMIYELE